MSYDAKCWELAEAFGQKDLTDPEIAYLAQRIQDVVEEELDWIKFRRKVPT